MKIYVVTVDTYAEGSEVKAVCNSLMLAKKIKNNVQEELEELGMDFPGSVLVNIREYPLITSEGEIEMLKGKIDPGRKIEANSPSRKFSYNEDYSKITTMLDRIAGSLQEKGLLKESKSIDVVSNTIEAGWLDNFNLFLNRILKKNWSAKTPNSSRRRQSIVGCTLANPG